MARRDSYEEKTEALLMPMLAEHQFELVDVEFIKEAGTWFLRAYIDNRNWSAEHCPTGWMKKTLSRKAIFWR